MAILPAWKTKLMENYTESHSSCASAYFENELQIEKVSRIKAAMPGVHITWGNEGSELYLGKTTRAQTEIC